MTSHRIVIMIFEGVELLDIAGPTQAFVTANRLLEREAQGYEVLLAGAQQGTVRCAGGVPLVAETSWDQVGRTADTIIVPGGVSLNSHGAAALTCPALIDWLSTAAPTLPRTAAVCTGAHILAAAGLLDGRRAVTHWATASQLATEYPDVSVDSDHIFIQDGHIWTSAGGATGIDLALALITADKSPEFSRLVARSLVMYLQRPGEHAQQSDFLTRSTAIDTRIRRLLNWIDANLTRELSISTLADEIDLSPRHFARVFRKQVGVTPGQYVEVARVREAARRLQHTNSDVRAIARAAGFGSVETLHRIFRQHYGLTPANFRRRSSEPEITRTAANFGYPNHQGEAAMSPSPPHPTAGYHLDTAFETAWAQ
ncbi:GlxA family transcriptional regulator [Nocardia sp. NBC_00416]|uniref:GlxA family transcriptional regulator n=1 Tax=Nocardia sp. NBC_00416 TaxID=2975991 RepID=UPI002E1EBD33